MAGSIGHAAEASAQAIHLRGRILPGGGRRDVFVTDHRITFEPVPGARMIVEDGYLLPGLVDCHAHLALASPAPAGAPPRETVRASARAQLERGVLAIREPGGPSRDSIGIGPSEGLPRVISGGRFLAAPGRYFRGLAREVHGSELTMAAEEEFRASGAWAKVVGDFFDEDGVIAPAFGLDDVRSAVQAVHAAGGRVAIHAMAAATIELAIEAGVDSIEHGTELAPEHLPEIARRHIAIVPTLVIDEAIVDTVLGWGSPGHEVRRWEEAVERQPEMIRRAASEGVAILAGTDAGMAAHGLILEEVARLARAGLDAEVALGSASWTARTWLGLAGIEEGARADIVAFGTDPRRPGHVERPLVRILDGRIVQG